MKTYSGVVKERREELITAKLNCLNEKHGFIYISDGEIKEGNNQQQGQNIDIDDYGNQLCFGGAVKTRKEAKEQLKYMTEYE